MLFARYAALEGIIAISMKHLAILLLSTALLTGCSNSDISTTTTAVTVPIPPDSPLTFPTLVIDAAHNMTDSNKPPAYQINASPGVWLDGSHYHFTDGTNDIAPNMVHIMVGNAFYRLYWPVPTNIFIISPITMDAIKGESFHGFQPGDHVDVIIGHALDSSGKEELRISWVGQIEVKSTNEAAGEVITNKLEKSAEK
jgi:hypothetical protein